MKFLPKLILSVLSGVILSLCFPIFDIGILIWIALVPLSIVLMTTDLKESFLYSFLTGAVFCLISLFWMNFFHPVALPMLALAYAFFTAVACAAENYARRILKLPLYATFPLFWTAMEYYRSIGLLGFPYGDLCYSQHSTLVLMQVSNVFGALFLTYVIAFVNSVIAIAVKDIIDGKPVFKPSKSSRIGILIAIAMLIFSIVYGIKELSGPIPENKLKVGLVQGNYPSQVYWEDVKEKVWTELKDYTVLASKWNAELVVWTETAIMEFVKFNPKTYLTLSELAKTNNVYLLTGAPDADFQIRKPLNSAFLFDNKGNYSGNYDKIHLAPFGEFIPHRKYLPLFDIIVPPTTELYPGDFKAGENYKVFNMGDKAKFSVLICYEGVFGDHVRKFVRRGAEFLVNITNDGWPKDAGSQYQHAFITVFRAVENGVSLVYAGNTGFTFLVNPIGKITKSIPIMRKGILLGNITIYHKKTFYTQHGDWLIVSIFSLAFALFALAIVVNLIRRKRLI